MKQLTLALTLAAIATGALTVESTPAQALPLGEDAQHTTAFFTRAQSCNTLALQGTYALNVTNTGKPSGVFVAAPSIESQTSEDPSSSDFIPFAAQMAFDGDQRFRAAFFDGKTYDGFYMREPGSCIAQLWVGMQGMVPVGELQIQANDIPTVERFAFVQIYLSPDSKGFTFDGVIGYMGYEGCVDCEDLETLTQIGGSAQRASTFNLIPYNPTFIPPDL
jgi:hypothetical protein